MDRHEAINKLEEWAERGDKYSVVSRYYLDRLKNDTGHEYEETVERMLIWINGVVDNPKEQ